MSVIKDTIGARLTAARKRLNLSRGKFIEKINADPERPKPKGRFAGHPATLEFETYRAWEYGTNGVPHEWIPILCKHLQCDVGYLYGEYDEINRDISFVCKYTGLSEKSVLALHSWRSWSYLEPIKILDLLILDEVQQNNGIVCGKARSYRSILRLLHFFFRFQCSDEKCLAHISGSIAPAKTSGTGINDIAIDDRIIENAVLMEMQQALINLKETHRQPNKKE